MAEGRSKELVRSIINGYPVMGALEGFTPPMVEKVMEEYKGGRFIANKQMTGATLGDASFELSGVSAELLESMGVSRGESCEVTVLGAAIDEEGAKVGLRWELSGEVVSFKEDKVGPGKESWTVTFNCFAYKYVDGGKVIYDINLKTQKMVIGGKDLLQEARALVELP